jgi:dihydrodipicolinate synthase/N-acetylneuraminate lyase
VSKPAPRFIAAIGTPLDPQEHLDVRGLRAHLEDQSAGEMDGVLVAGSMGAMQLLADDAYRDLIKHSVEFWSGRGELLVGIGDASFARSRDRLRSVNEFSVDGAVVLAPYVTKFPQEELIDYFQALAAESRAPLYLYDLPQLTGTSLHIETVLKLSQHPNIRGIKCSGDVAQVRALVDAVAGSGFRVIIAQPLLVDLLLRHGMNEHLDGLFAMFPHWVKQMKNAVREENWPTAAQLVQSMDRALRRLVHYGVLPAMTVLLNARGISGSFAPKPYRALNPKLADELCQEPALRALAVH